MMSSGHASAAAAPPRICVITGGGPYAWAVIRFLAESYGPLTVILEAREPRMDVLRRRIRVCGLNVAASQLVTMCAMAIGRRVMAGRIQRILGPVEVDARHEIVKVPSVNSAEAAAALRSAMPDVILTVGCRLLSKATISTVKAPLLNLHPGILPEYRGHHSGYWALASGDAPNFGCTVHLIDPGADTGTMLRQARGCPDRGDNILTYQARLALIAGPLAVDAVEDALLGRLNHLPNAGRVELHLFQPSPWQYLSAGWKRGVW